MLYALSAANNYERKEIALTLKCSLGTLVTPADPPAIMDAAKKAYTGHNTE